MVDGDKEKWADWVRERTDELKDRMKDRGEWPPKEVLERVKKQEKKNDRSR